MELPTYLVHSHVKSAQASHFQDRLSNLKNGVASDKCKPDTLLNHSAEAAAEKCWRKLHKNEARSWILF